jgi:flagellar hook assembly protein FlgD
VPDALTRACSRTAPLRAVSAALVAAAVLAAALATVTPVAPAQAAGWTGPVIDLWEDRVWLSPNGDHVQDRTRLAFDLGKTARVTVKVRRANKARTLVHAEELGKLGAGHHTWTWKGKDSDRDVVRDGRYSAIFVADQVGRDGKKRIRSAAVVVDTEFDVPEKPVLSTDTLFPRTTLLHDALAVTVGGKGRLATVGRAVMKVTDAQGRVVRRSDDTYDLWPSYMAVFDGRDNAGTPLPGGDYTLGFRVWDKAGNSGRSERVGVHVSDKTLVEATGTLVVPPAGVWHASDLLAGSAVAAWRGTDGRASTTGGDDPQPAPCGTVVESEVYPDAGAKSYRSADTCRVDHLSPRMAWAGGYLSLDNLTSEVAPRGLYSSRVAMRGRPTVADETDTAEIFDGGIGFDSTGTPTRRGSASSAVAEETVTSTPSVTRAQPPFYSRATNAPSVTWTIATYGVDSFDVADVTVSYSYLTPRR